MGRAGGDKCISIYARGPAGGRRLRIFVSMANIEVNISQLGPLFTLVKIQKDEEIRKMGK